MGDAVNPELEAEIAEEEKAIAHLVRSNAELEAHLKEFGSDKELRDAVGENIVTIARKRAALELKYDERKKLEASRPVPTREAPPAPRAEAPPRPPAPAEAPPAVPEGGVYL